MIVPPRRPGATVANTNQRRVLFLQNPAQGQYYASVQEVRPEGTSNYNGLLLQAQRRRANGFSLQANYTISRCMTDRWNSGPGVDGFSVMEPGNPDADRARCANSPEHNLNSSIVYQIPQAGTGQWLNPAAFQRPAEGTYGTMPLDAIQGSHRWNIDTALSRSFGRGGRQLQVRIEAFNLLNTVTPGNPQTTLSSSDFGRITSVAVAPRVLQLGIKYQF